MKPPGAIKLGSVQEMESLPSMKSILISEVTVSDHSYSQAPTLFLTEGFTLPAKMQLIFQRITIDNTLLTVGGELMYFKHSSTEPTIVDQL